MSTEHWEQMWSVFEEALQRPAEQRPAFLDEACGRDKNLRRGVEEMLTADQQADSFLDQPFIRPGIDGDAMSRNTHGERVLARGTTIGPYRLLRRIGQGGMGTVYLAVRDDDTFERRVVIKLIRPDMESKSLIERMRIERRILASLDHPYIARLYDGGTTDDGLPYFVLEYIEGVPIDEFCDQNQLSVDERLTLFRKVCAAVHYAHQNLVVHRDLKPSNILTVPEGDPKLLDFGIAKLLNPDLAGSGLEPTATWHRVLTPNYASPEQIRGKLITTASDVYSLGVLLYKLLTGHLPHHLEGRSAHEIESILTESEPLPPSVAAARPREDEGTAEASGAEHAGPDEGPRPAELRRQLSGDLDAIVLKALRSAPQRRYGSVEQLAADIERFQAGLPVAARAGTWRYRAGKFLRRNRATLAAVAAVALLVVGFAIAMALQASRVAFERDQARREQDKKTKVLTLILELFQFSDPYVHPGQELTVREALERSVPVLKEGLHDQPGVRAALLYTSGSILANLGVLAPARDQLEEALELRKGLYSDDHPELAESMTALASVYKKLGDFDQAETLVRGAVAVARGPQGQPGLLCGALNELASVLCYQNDYEAAEVPVGEALALARDLFQDNKQITALEYLAKVRSSQKDDREAVKLYREAVVLRRARYGEKHPAQIATLNNLGANLKRMGDLDAAEQIYKEALDLQREVFGAERVDFFLLNNLASLLEAREDHAAAERLFREARDALAAKSDSHPSVFFFELRIANTRIHQGAAAEAENSLRRHLERWRLELGDHWRIAQGQNLLGESVSLQGRCAEAETLLSESFEELLEKASDKVHQDAFDRLREHFERCGKPLEIARFRAMLDALPQK